MELGMIGLGRMGASMVRRLLRAGQQCVVYDLQPQAVEALAKEGAIGATSLEDLTHRLRKPRALWLMLPAAAVDPTLSALVPLLARDDVVIDGGNSHYHDDIRRAVEFKPTGIHYVDVGTSGGVWGLERGYCLMIGGDAAAIQRLEPILAALAPSMESAPRTPGREKASGTAERGYLHYGPSGAGHFVKMVHNGIEYGIMAAYAEGLNILHHANASRRQLTADAETTPLRHPEITLSEDFGVERRGAFYESAGCLRDVIQNHLFQIVALLAMEPPAYRGFGAVHNEKAKVFQAMRPLSPDDLVRGQYAGYRKEPNVAKRSDVETFCALKLFIDSWRWQGVPWYLRSGKFLSETAAEVLVELKAPPQRLFADSEPVAGRANYVRFRLSPSSAVALAARVKRAGKEFVGDQRELYLLEAQPGEEAPYERLLENAMAGDGALFTREDAVEAAWAVVDPVLKTHHRVRPYKRGSWGPKEADALIARGGRWHNPRPKETECQ